MADLNADNLPNLIMMRNDKGLQVETGPIDSGNGVILLNEGKGIFRPLPARQSGFWATHEARDLKILNASNGQKLFLVGNYNRRAQVFEAGRM